MNKLYAALLALGVASGTWLGYDNWPGSPPAYSRIAENDLRLLPQGAALADWFFKETVAVPPDRDPWFPGARVVRASLYGAVPDDGIDDTAAIQAAYDVACDYVKWDMTPRSPEDDHGFIILDPGVYQVSQIHPCAGTTLHGYGATLQRPPWSWWLDRHDGNESSARDEAGSAAARIINGWGYHPRIEYRWRGTSASPPMRFVGVTLDGNVASGGFPDWTDYQFWNAHLAVFDSTGESGTQENVGNLRVELIDVTAKESPSDCVAVVANVDLYVRRYQSDGCFRGALNSLGSNNYIDAQYLYLSGPPGNFRGIDREPMGTSTGFDRVTGEDWTLSRRSAREYWHIRDAVLAGGLDIASSVLAEDSTSAQGGTLLLERVYVLRPHTLNLIIRAANADRSPTLTVRDSWIRGGSIVGFNTGAEDGSWWGLSNVRWSSRIRFERTTFVLAKPTEAHLAMHPGKLYPTMINLDQSTLASRQWPDTTLELVDCRFELDAGWDDSEHRARSVLRAIQQNGNAGQNHTLRVTGGSVAPGYDFALYQFHGGRAVLDGFNTGGAAVHACSYNPPGWTFDIALRGASAEATRMTCQGGVGEWEVTP